MSEQETLRVTGGGSGLEALVARACGLDASAMARLRQRGDSVEVYVTTPFGVAASRRVEGRAGRDGAVVSAQVLYSQLSLLNSATPSPMTLQLGAPRDPSWPGALPPVGGFQLVDEVPVSVARELADKGQALARQFSGPLGPPASLLNQTVVEVDSADGHVHAAIPMRMIFTCVSLGLIPSFAAPLDIPRHLRVSTTGRWVRIDAPFGTVYHSERFSLLVG